MNNFEKLELTNSIKEQAIGLLRIRYFLKTKIKIIKSRRKWASELSGVDYTRERVQSFGLSDPTAEHAITAVMQEPNPEMIQYTLNLIEQAIESLPAQEKKLIKTKYQKGITHTDEFVANQMYMSRGGKFNSIKKNAIKLFAFYVNLFSLDYDQDFVQFSENKYYETME